LGKNKFTYKKTISGIYLDIPNDQNKIYLTFDDGPTPEITDCVITKKYGATATFFALVKNILDNLKYLKE
jgi:peptidoglycan/xylan/chitin deacetylase (PgdA/CDA1 family)